MSHDQADGGTDPGEPPKDYGRAGRNLPAAIGVGVILGAAALISLYTIKVTFLVLVVAAVGAAVWELSRALGSRDIRVPLIPLGVGSAAMLVGAYVDGPRSLAGALALTMLAIMIWRIPGGADGYVRDMTASLFAAMYVPFLAGFAALLLAAPDGDDRVVTFIAVTIASDIGGYAAGVLFGRHPLAPKVSPKKTWEGSAGSMLASVVCGGVLLPVLFHGAIWQGVIVGAAAMLTATAGDLVESVIKRDLGVKDLGTLLPGHGGVMDRLDSLLATVPVYWLLMTVFVPHM
jgi:phosphatidate cytidylyltransferase